MTAAVNRGHGDLRRVQRNRPEHRDGHARGLRPLVALALVALLAANFSVLSDRIRHVEAVLASWTVGLFTKSSVHSNDFYVTHARSGGVWFVVTSECTVGILAAPLLVLAAWTALQRRVPLVGALVGLAAGLVTAVGFNTVRLSAIGLSWHRWGRGSFWFTHNVGGTLISLFSTVLAMGVQIMLSGIRRTSVQRDFGPAHRREV